MPDTAEVEIRFDFADTVPVEGTAKARTQFMVKDNGRFNFYATNNAGKLKQLRTLPAGGTAGQVLAKLSSIDSNVGWIDAAGTGDMLKAVYDPTNIAGDAFDMDNMVEGATNLILSPAERSKLANLDANGNPFDQSLNSTDSPAFNNLGLSGTFYMLGLNWNSIPFQSPQPANATQFLRGDGTWQDVAGGGNPFDQDLNTTDDVTFNSVQIDDSIIKKYSPTEGYLGIYESDGTTLGRIYVKQVGSGAGDLTLSTGIGNKVIIPGDLSLWQPLVVRNSSSSIIVQGETGQTANIFSVVNDISTELFGVEPDAKLSWNSISFNAPTGADANKFLRGDGTWQASATSNPFDQDLNTTDDVTFNSVTTTGSIWIGGPDPNGFQLENTGPGAALWLKKNGQDIAQFNARTLSFGQYLLGGNGGQMEFISGPRLSFGNVIAPYFTAGNAGHAIKTTAKYAWSTNVSSDPDGDTQLKRVDAGAAGIYAADGLTLGTFWTANLVAVNDLTLVSGATNDIILSPGSGTVNLNSSGSAVLGIYGSAGSTTAEVNLGRAGSRVWHFGLDTSDNFNIVESGVAIRAQFAPGGDLTLTGGNLYVGGDIIRSSGNMALDAAGGGQIFLRRSGANMWALNGTNDWTPAVNNIEDLGTITTKVRTGYFGTSIVNDGDLIWNSITFTAPTVAEADKFLRGDGSWQAISKTKQVSAAFDGGGSDLAVGSQVWVTVPISGTITKVTLLADQSGSVQVDIWKDTYANYPPTDTESITSLTPPAITAADKSVDSTLTNWTTAVTAGDILMFNVDSCSGIQALSVAVEIEE